MRNSDPTEQSCRAAWEAVAIRLASPVLTHLAEGRLHAEMPVEASVPEDRRPFSRLEAAGRLLAGLAPWLELSASTPKCDPGTLKWADLARQALAQGLHPTSPDRFNFTKGAQPLVDAAFLAQAFLRAPTALWAKLDTTTQERVLSAFKETRNIVPHENNWWLFAGMIECFLLTRGEEIDKERLNTALVKHEAWYLGDGVWGDGAEFHWDYYNAFVIQPMLVDIMVVMGRQPIWADYAERVEIRTRRFAAIQERLIAVDGSFPAIGRSLVYRCGAFQALAQAALRGRLPENLPPGQVRRALSLVIHRTLGAPDTFDPAGWLRIGLCGHQPSLAEPYICTGSLYLCSTAFLPLGLPGNDGFWQNSEQAITSEKAWGGIDLTADKALSSRGKMLPANQTRTF